MNNGGDIYDNHYLNAKMYINDATNFKVDMSMIGVPSLGYIGMERFLRLTIFRPRSSALICAKNMNKIKTPFRDVIFGKRKHGDFMLYAKLSNFNATKTHLPRHEIEFHDNNAVLTSVRIRLNVSN